MARVLRSRAVASPKTNDAATPDKTPKGKRKAVEQPSPIVLKKQKSAQKDTETKAAKSPKAKAVEDKKEKGEKKEEKKEEKKTEKKTEKKKESKKEQKKEDMIEMDEDSESEGHDDEENLQVLAVNLDPEEEAAVNEEEFQPGQDVGKIPKVSKDVQKSIKASKEEPGVVYIGRIPHGFYEYEMKQYLSQFGPISRLRLSRNKKTGASKHFAFVEFTEASTAEIVSKTMDNYLLFGHILKCKILNKEQIHDDLFKGANRRFKKVPWNKMAGIQLQKPLTESTWEAKVAKERGNRAKKAAKLKELGYEFEAPELKKVPAPAAIENGEPVKAIEAAPEVAPEEEKQVEETKEVDSEEKAETPAKLKSSATPKKTPKAKAAKSTIPKTRKTKA